MPSLVIRRIAAGDVKSISHAFRELGWNKPAAQYENYLIEQEEGQRDVLVAFLDGRFSAYVTIVWESAYPTFSAEGIPEIVDLNVLPCFRRHGIATALMDAAEERIQECSPVAGVGVGLDADYGAAQRLYVLRGYVPDGRGLMANRHPVQFGNSVAVDDNLVLYFTKRLKGE